MGLETGNYLADLNIANPTATDQKSQGDDHLRLIKTTLRQSFPGFAGAVIASGTNGGSANTYTLTPATALVSYVSPMLAVFIPAADNTGAATLNISALGAKSIKSVSGAALAAGELVSGKVYVAAYDGTNFNLIAPTKGYIDQLAFATELPLQTGNAGKFVKTDGSQASWDAIDASDITGFSAAASAVRTGTTTSSALTPGDTYNALAEVTLTYAATVTPDMSTFINAVLTLTGNVTLANPTNAKVGQSGFIRIVQDGTGSRLLSAVGSSWKRAGGLPTLTTTASATDVLFYQVLPSFIIYDVIKSPS